MGATMVGISAACQEPRNTKFTTATSPMAISMVVHTSFTASRVKLELS